jgi:hypothetical protein
MICPRSIAVVALAAMFLAAAAWAHDETKYPDWSGQWLRTGGIQSDPTRPIGRGQQPDAGVSGDLRSKPRRSSRGRSQQ